MAENPNACPSIDDDLGPVAAAITAKVTAAFAPSSLDLVNQSHLHAGHAGAPAHDDPAKAESHFRLRLVSEAFEGRSRIERQRMINEALADELAGPVHALSIEAKTPGEV